ncbi:hypothetical protein K461DRAFT_305631 [Myriangium duriaei CBS 260.36]|uniref:Rhodopsin domain-containing protein n=1 Tax=Myriangium duriaei CBS 260.36 TaxID=1168546 RepID=A0A9P4J0B6_9PEZI|nr:hypothetical protein K461DRAFT_305631 [Myriangium duriaei CBS 260.36]
MLAEVTTGVAQTTNYIFMPIAGLILILRMVASKYQPKPFDISFFVVVLSFVVLVARTIATHYTVGLGTASDALTAQEKGNPFSADKLAHVKEGTFWSLATRVFETSFWWLQTSLLLLLYRRLVAHIKWSKAAALGAWIFLGISYCAIIITIFTECHPLHLYWDVDIAARKCDKAYRTTILQCTSLIILDLSLMVIASPVLFVKGRSVVQRVRIGGLFALGLLCTVFSSLRMAYIFAEGSSQAGRAFWSGMLVVVSAFVANAPIIYGSLTLFTKGAGSSKGDSRYNTGPSNAARMTRDNKSGGFGLDTKVKITTTVAVVSVSEKEGGSEKDLEAGPVTVVKTRED